MFRAIKIKAFIVFCTMHAGLGFLLYSLFRSSELRATDPRLFWSLAIGIGGLYGGFLLGGLFLYLPVAPWIDRFHKLRDWRSWILDELPTLIAVAPVVAGIFILLRTVIQELFSMGRKGNLDWKNFQKLAKKYQYDFVDKVNAAKDLGLWDDGWHSGHHRRARPHAKVHRMKPRRHAARRSSHRRKAA